VLDRLHDELRLEADVAAELSEADPVLVRAAAAGTQTALLPVALVMAAIEEALRRGLGAVHYLSREGLFLERVHAAVAPVLEGATVPRAVHLATSRRSTFGASLSGATRDELSRMWSMYGEQSPRAMLTSMGVEPETLEEALRVHGLALDEPVPDVAVDPRIAAFLEDAEVRHGLDLRLAEARALLREYLLAHADIQSGQVLLCDVGWRGTIQDNLARVVPEVDTVGVYLGLFPFLNPQPENSHKQAVAFDGNLGDDYSFVNPPAGIERPWTPDAPSTVAYVRDERGEVTPVSESSEVAASRAIEAYQEAVVQAAPTVARFLLANGLAAGALREALGGVVRAYYEDPVPGLPDLWFDSGHDDTFGALNVTPFGKDRPVQTWLRASWSPEAVAAGSYWPEGYLRWAPVRSLVALRTLMAQRRGGRS
jgi:hypothetical protein